MRWHYWPVGFGLTLALEAPLVLWLLASAEASLSKRLTLILFGNLATHPLVWFFFPLLPWGRPLSIALSELWAFGAEALFYWSMTERLTLRQAVTASLLANATSFSFGWVLVRYCRDWLFPL